MKQGCGVTYTLANTSGALSPGDAFCSANDPSDASLVTKALPAALLNAGSVIGLAAIGVSPGASFTHTDAMVPNSATRLGNGAIRRVGVNGSARSYRISIPKGGETIVGFCDKTGNV